MKKRSLALIAAVFLLLSACGGDGEAARSPSPDPVPSAGVSEPASPESTSAPDSVESGPVNPLTGLPMDEQWVNARPVAVMLNNIKEALPQLGVAQADIIYEVPVEGGITRMLGVFQSTEGVGLIGSVRSARAYYLELALGHDAVFLHAGGSPEAYEKIQTWSVTSLDCVKGYEGTLFWRDPDRVKNNGSVHSVVTSGEKIGELFPTYSFRKEHEDGYRYEMTFAQDAAPADGQQALTVRVPFSAYKTGVFTYDPDTGKYLVEEFGSAHVDGNTGEQLAVTNVIVLQTACKLIAGDTAGRITVDLTSGGAGWFACGGKLIPITWSKSGADGQLVYTTQTGEPLTLGAGNSYVNIIPLEYEITVE